MSAVSLSKDIAAAAAYRMKSIAFALVYRGRRMAPASPRAASASSARFAATHMPRARVFSTYAAVMADALARADVRGEGLVCEFGVASGLSVNFIAEHTERTVYGFDSFDGLPEDWRPGYSKGAFARSRLPHVRPNVELVKGLFHETLPSFLAAHPQRVSFLHVDCDLYSSTVTVLSALRGRIQPGCVIVFDEYLNFPGWEDGEHKAFAEFVAAEGLSFEYLGYNRLHEQVSVLITGKTAA